MLFIQFSRFPYLKISSAYNKESPNTISGWLRARVGATGVCGLVITLTTSWEGATSQGSEQTADLSDLCKKLSVTNGNTGEGVKYNISAVWDIGNVQKI